MPPTPFFKTDCPSCGAPVEAHSASTVTLVCGYCNTMLVRQDDGVVDSGRDSALLEDFSPLQIGTTGTFAAQNFTLLGRLQVHYDDGVWNEWYALFDDGKAGWLSEAGDLYVMTLPAEIDNPPRFEDTRAGFSAMMFQDKRFLAADVRRISLKRTAAQGELPFDLPEERESKVADWRCENFFITLDYSRESPEAFYGRMVELSSLNLSNTRSDDAVIESAGRLKGSIAAEDCPNCGSPVHWVGGLATHLNCPSCGSEIEIDQNKARLIAADNMQKAQKNLFTLPVGTQGRLNNRPYHVIGAVRYAETDAQDTFENLFGSGRRTLRPEGQWSEYLLYNPSQGFVWLVETDEGWSLSQTLDKWPRLDRNGQPQGCGKLYDYGGRVEAAAGAFYWRIRRGDVNYYSDYQDGAHRKICAELNTRELAWSRSMPIDHREIAKSFNIPTKTPAYTAQMQADGVDTPLRLVMITVLAVVNLPAFIISENPSVFAVVLIGAWILWSMGKEDED